MQQSSFKIKSTQPSEGLSRCSVWPEKLIDRVFKCYTAIWSVLKYQLKFGYNSWDEIVMWKIRRTCQTLKESVTAKVNKNRKSIFKTRCLLPSDMITFLNSFYSYRQLNDPRRQGREIQIATAATPAGGFGPRACWQVWSLSQKTDTVFQGFAKI